MPAAVYTGMIVTIDESRMSHEVCATQAYAIAATRVAGISSNR